MDTDEKREMARIKANRVRYSRSALKQSIAWGEIEVWKVIMDPPSYIHTVQIDDFLMWQDGWGPVKTYKFIGKLEISSNRIIGQLTDRQRRKIAIRLGMRA